MKTKTSRNRVALALLAMAAMSAGVVWVSLSPGSSPMKSEVVARPAEASPGSLAGSMVFIDPVTKQLRQPEAAEIAALINSRRGNGAVQLLPPKQIIGAGGAPGLVLGQEHEVATVVTKTPDGKLLMGEVTGLENARTAVVPGSQIAPKKEVLDEK